MNTKTSKLLSVLLSLVMLLSLAGPLAPSARAEGPYKVGIDDISNGSVTADKETANEGETVRLTVTPSAGYIIESISVYAITLHTTVPTTYSEGNYVFTMPASEVQASATFRPAAPTTTEIPSVGQALTLPAAGGSYGGSATASITSGTGFTLTGAKWFNGGTPETNPGCGLAPSSFEAGKPYFAEIYLTAEDGYGFTESTAVTLTGGATVKSTARDHGITTLTIVTNDYTIPAAPAATPIPSVAVTVTEPAVGAAMGEASAESGANYTVTKTEWLEPVEGGGTKATSDTVFAAGKTYLVAATLTPNSGYVFSSETTGTVNGKNATDLYFEDPAFIVYLEFTLSAPATTYTVTLIAYDKTNGTEQAGGEVAFSDSGKGTRISGDYEGNSSRTVGVYPASDYSFAGWAKGSPSGEIVSTSSPYTFTVTEDVTLYALFEKITTYPVWVGGVQVTSANKDDILGDGTFTYDHDSQTLTVNKRVEKAVVIKAEEDLNVANGGIGSTQYLFAANVTFEMSGYDLAINSGIAAVSSSGVCKITAKNVTVTTSTEYYMFNKADISAEDTLTLTCENGTVGAGGSFRAKTINITANKGYSVFHQDAMITALGGDVTIINNGAGGYINSFKFTLTGANNVTIETNGGGSGYVFGSSSSNVVVEASGTLMLTNNSGTIGGGSFTGKDIIVTANRGYSVFHNDATITALGGDVTIKNNAENGYIASHDLKITGAKDVSIWADCNGGSILNGGATISASGAVEITNKGGWVTYDEALDITAGTTVLLLTQADNPVVGGTLTYNVGGKAALGYTDPSATTGGVEIPSGTVPDSSYRKITIGEPASVTEYPVWVGGEQVTSLNKDDILGDGTASFDPATNTLTLTDATISTYGSGNAGIRAVGIDLIIEGSGSVSGAFGSNGIAVSAKDGSGGNLTLNANLAVSGFLAAIQAENTLTIKGGEVTTSNSSSSSTAVKAGAVDIQGGKVNAECSGDRAFKVTGDFTMSGGEVTAKYGNYGIDVGGDVTVSDGTLTADGAMFGIITTGGDVTISGGTVTSSATSSTTNSTGISAKGNITISGGSVTATGGRRGIYAGGDVTISGGTVTATGTDIEGSGIIGDNVTISGGTVTAKGGSSGIYGGDAVKIENGITKVTADGDMVCIICDEGVITLGDGLMIQEPTGGKLSADGQVIKNADDIDATHAVIVPGTVTPLPKVVGIKVNVTGTQENAGAYDVTTDTLETSFESITAPVTMSTSFLYTDQACQAEDKLTTAPVAGTPYYFVISIDAYTDGETPTLEWADNDTIKSGSTLTADNGTVEIVEFFHSPAGGSLSVICKYTETSTPGTHTVTFEANGGTPVPEAQTVADGGKATKPADPTKPGVSFGGWYKDSELTEPFDFNTPITADITLYASWNQYIYMLQIKKVWEDDDDAAGKRPDSVDVKVLGNGTEIGTVTLTKDEGWKKLYVMATGEADLVLTCEEIVPEGYTLKDMTRDGDTIILTNQFGVTPPAPKTHTVTFEPNGGSAVPAQTVNDGEKATKPADPTRSGFVFDGWYADATFSVAFDFSAPITADVTVYAKWKEETAPGDIVYTVVSGGNSTWTKGSSSGVTIVVKRDPNDEECFSHFASVQIDGTALVNGTDYTAVAGSTVITLNASALQKLTTGTKTVTINFDDGKAATDLTIKAGSSGTGGSTSPKTGDDSKPGLWLAVMMLSGLGIGGLVVNDKKRRYTSKQ